MERRSLLFFNVLFFSCIHGFIRAADMTAEEQLARQQPLSPRVEAMLAKIQAQAAKHIEANRTVQKPAENPFAALIQAQEDGLKNRGVHVHQPTQEERVQDMLTQRTAGSPLIPQPVPSFIMRADGRPLRGQPSVHTMASTHKSSKINQIKGCLKIERDEEDVPPFRVYFEGMETTNNDEGFFSFPVDADQIDKYSIIICNKIQHTLGRHNTVESFGLIPDMNYKHFRFKHHPDGGGKWMQEEKDLRKRNLEIPHNAIVITINPSYFARLEESWPGSFDGHVLKLPRIVFKEGHRAKIKRKSDKSLLYGLDMSPFHTHVKHASREIGNGKGEILVYKEG
ncbi:hypothetical protein FJ364_02365 [Candidatus Dependentiae bacterium]|nr:hypothetical protein [Candidatus Dependentiae bacterium]